MDGQGTKYRRNIAENLKRLSRAHERCRRQTTDGRAKKNDIDQKIALKEGQSLRCEGFVKQVGFRRGKKSEGVWMMRVQSTEEETRDDHFESPAVLQYSSTRIIIHNSFTNMFSYIIALQICARKRGKYA